MNNRDICIALKLRLRMKLISVDASCDLSVVRAGTVYSYAKNEESRQGRVNVSNLVNKPTHVRDPL